MSDHRKKVIISLGFVVILIIIVLALTAFLPFGLSKHGIPPLLPAGGINM